MNKFFRILLSTSFIVCGFMAHAQRGNQTSIIIGTELDLPINMNKYPQVGVDVHYWGGYGVNAKLEKPITSSLHFTAGLGFVFLQANPNDLFGTVGGSGANGSDFYYYDDSYDSFHKLYVYLPVTAGLKYYVSKYFYVNGEVGNAFKISGSTYNSFVYSGGGGAVLPIGPHHGLDFNIRYERGYKTTEYDRQLQQIGMNLAYKYSF